MRLNNHKLFSELFANLIEGARIVSHGLRAGLFGPKRYSGDAEEICSTITELCWNQNNGYYKTSLNNYPLFYVRDFGMCIDSLLSLGFDYRERVFRTLEYALEHYKRSNRVTQFITPSGRPTDFLSLESPDSLAFLLHSLVSVKRYVRGARLLKSYSTFLEGEIGRVVKIVLEPKTGLVKRGVHLSGMRDYAVRDSSCYDNVMLGAISRYADELNLHNPLRRYDYQKILLSNFWTGEYFKDDLSSDRLTGDANVPVFWFRLLSKNVEKKLFPKVLRTMKRAKLDLPCALRYESAVSAKKSITKTKMVWLERFVGGWERDTVWLHLGNMFLQVLSRLDKTEMRLQLKRHKGLIEEKQCYPEVLTRDGRLFKTLFFHSEDSMLWAVNYLSLSKSL